jgi:hypothetical protein
MEDGEDAAAEAHRQRRAEQRDSGSDRERRAAARLEREQHPGAEEHERRRGEGDAGPAERDAPRVEGFREPLVQADRLVDRDQRQQHREQDPAPGVAGPGERRRAGRREERCQRAGPAERRALSVGVQPVRVREHPGGECEPAHGHGGEPRQEGRRR